MADFKLTERSDGTIYLQCRCGEIGYPCDYQGAITCAPAGLTLLRQARIEAFTHCWSQHKIPAYRVGFDISYYASQQATAASAMRPMLVTTTKPQKTAPQADNKEEVKAGA